MAGHSHLSELERLEEILGLTVTAKKPKYCKTQELCQDLLRGPLVLPQHPPVTC